MKTKKIMKRIVAILLCVVMLPLNDYGNCFTYKVQAAEPTLAEGTMGEGTEEENLTGVDDSSEQNQKDTLNMDETDKGASTDETNAKAGAKGSDPEGQQGDVNQQGDNSYDASLSANLDDFGIMHLGWVKNDSTQEQIGYEVYKNGSLLTTLTAAGFDPCSYLDEELEAGTEYTYYVQYSEGEEEKYSNQVTISTPQKIVIEKYQNYHLTEDMVVFSVENNNGYLYLDGHTLTIQRNYVQNGGYLYFDQGSLICNGNLTKSGYGYLKINNEQDYLCVKGNILFENAGYENYNKGCMEVKGDFTVDENSGSIYGNKPFKLVLSGSEKQTISLPDGTQLYEVEFQNTSEDGIWFTNPFQIEQLTDHGILMQYVGVNGQYGRTLTEDETFEGDFVLISGDLDLNGHSLNIKGNFIQLSGSVLVNGGSLTVEKDYRIQGNFNTTSQGYWLIGKGLLVMTKEDDLVQVGGDFVYCTSSDSNDLLTAGKLDVKGNLDFGGNEYFTASGTHQVILSGETEQTMSGYGWELQNLLLRNTSEEGIVLEDCPTVFGTVTTEAGKVTGMLTLTETTSFDGKPYEGGILIENDTNIIQDLCVGGDLKINAYTNIYKKLEVMGDCMIDSTVDLAGANLIVHGDLMIRKTMYANHAEENDVAIRVDGDLIVSSAGYVWLSGTTEVKGDILVEGSILADEGHVLVLSGDQGQIINVTDETRFSIVDLQNHSEDGVVAKSLFSKSKLNKNDCKFSYEFETDEDIVVLEEDTVHDGDYILEGGYLQLAGHSLTIKGDLIHKAGTIMLDGGQLIVEGNYYLQNREGSEGEYFYSEGMGRLLMNSETDYVLVKGKFVSETTAFDDTDLTAGVLEVKGDFETGSDSWNVRFRPDLAHKVILSGSTMQTVKLGYDDHFQNLELNNTSAEGIVFSENAWVYGEIQDKSKNSQGEIKLYYETSGYFHGDAVAEQLNELRGDLVIDGKLRINGYYDSAMEIYGSVTVKGDLEGGPVYVKEGGVLSVDGSLSSEYSMYAVAGVLNAHKDLTLSRIRMEDGGHVTVDGDCTVYYGIEMQDANDYLLIKGDLNYSSSDDFDTMTAGIIEIQGNLYSQGTIRAAKSHRFLFSGNQKQLLQLNSKDAFAIVELQNTSSEGVVVDGLLIRNELIKNNSKFSYLDANTMEWVLEQDVTMQGDYTLAGKYVNLNGHKLTIEGNLLMDAGLLIVNGGTLIIGKNLYLKKNSLAITAQDGNLAGDALLRMNQEEDLVVINGDFFVNTSADSEGYLTDGVIEACGNVTFAAEDNEKAFHSAENHEVRLAGNKKQTISVLGNAVKVQNLTLTNNSEDGIEIDGDFVALGKISQDQAKVTGTLCIGDSTTFDGSIYHGDIRVSSYVNFTDELTIDGNLYIAAYCYFSGKTNVTGNCEVIDGGTLNVSYGQLVIAKDLVISAENAAYVDMSSSSGYLCVEGNAYFSPANYSSYSMNYGVLEIKGDLISERGLFTKAPHKILLSGTKKQTVQTATNASVGSVEITNQSEAGVEFLNSFTIGQMIAENAHFIMNGKESLAAFALSGDKTYSGDLVVVGGTLDLNGHTMTVHGDLVQNCTEMNLNGGTLIVDGDFLQPSGNMNVNGGSLVVGGDYRLQDCKETENGLVYDMGKGSLIMTQEADHVVVNGDLYVDSSINSNGKLTAGVLELKKNLVVSASNKYANGFRASEQHVLKLSGDSQQTISELGREEGWYNSRVTIRNLVIDNQSEEGVYFECTPEVSGEITDASENHVSGSIYMVETTSFANNYFGGSISTFRIPMFEELEIGGDFYCGSIYVSYNNKKHIGGNLIIHGDACFEGSSSGDWLKIDAENFQVDGTLRWTFKAELTGSMHVGQDLILGDNGLLEVNGGNAIIERDFLMDATTSSCLMMAEKNTHVLVKGNMTYQPVSDTACYFGGGMLEVQGDFIAKQNFETYSDFWLAFTGDKKQTVTLTEDCTIRNLKLWNTSEEGIVLSSSLTVSGGLSYNQGKLSGGEILGNYAIVLSEDEVWEGDQYLNRTLDLNGHSLRITGNLYHIFGYLYVSGGTLEVEGDYICPETNLDYENLSSTSYYISKPGSDEDRFIVDGNMILNGKNPTGTFYSKNVELKGDLTQNGKQFQTVDDATLVLTGEHKQSIKALKNSVLLVNLDNQNTSEEGVEFLGTIYVSGEMKLNEKAFGGTISMYSRNTVLADKKYCGNMNLYGTLPMDLEIVGNVYMNGTIIPGDVHVIGDVTGQMSISGKVTVDGNVVLNKQSISMNEGELIIHGNLSAQATGSCIYMRHANDYILVTGNVDHSTQNTSNTALTAGVFEVQGNFTSKGGILATEEHRFLFSGNKEQKVSITGGEYFSNVELQNYSDEGVIFENLTIKNELITNGCNCRQSGQKGVFGWTLYEDETYDGDLILTGLTLDLNGHSLTVKGNLIQTTGKVVLNGGSLTVEGNYWIQNYQMVNGAYKAQLGTGALVMRNSDDRVVVEGNLEINTTENMDTMLTAGTLIVKGDFTDLSAKGFQASGEHKLSFMGDKDQKWNKTNYGTVGNLINCCQGTLSVYTTNVQVLGTLEAVRNSFGPSLNSYKLCVKSLNQIKNGIWAGALTVNGDDKLTQDVTVGSLSLGGNQYLNGHHLNCKNLTITGVCWVNNGSIRCEDYLSVKRYLIMQNEADYVFVGGNFVIDSVGNHNGYLTDGTLEIQGNFSQSGYDNFIATNNHKVILSRRLTVDDSNRIQNVNFGRNPGTTKFNILILKKDLQFYKFANDLDLITNQVIYDIEDASAPSPIESISAAEIEVTSVTLQYQGAWDESGILGYEIFRDGEKIAVTNDTTYVDTGLVPSTKYTYTVYPFDVYRNRCENSPEVSATTKDDVDGPSKPKGVARDAGTGSSITIRWNSSTDNDMVESYAVFRNGSKVGKDLKGTSFEDVGLETNKAYRYVVVAYDRTGNMSESSDVLETTVSMPQIMSILPGDYSVIGGDSAKITVVYRRDGNAKGNRVKIEWQPFSQEGEGVADWTLLTTTLAPQEGYGYNTLCSRYELDLSDVYGTKDYKLRFTLYDAQDNTAVRELVYHVDKQAADLPENISAVSNNAVVSLRFDASVNADCTGYEIYRRDAAMEELELVAELKDRFSCVYADATVTPKETYYYAIRTKDKYGNISEFSEEVGVTVDEDRESPQIKEIAPVEKRIGGETTLEIHATDNREVSKIRALYRQENSDQWIHIGEADAIDGMAKIAWNTVLLKDDVYVVSAVAVDANGNESKNTFVRRYETDNTGISKIEVTDVTTTATAVQLRWKDVDESDFAYFKVEQLVGTEFVGKGTVSDKLGYAQTDLKPNTTYSFRVVGYDDLGNRGECSDVVECTTKEDTTKPTIEGVYPTSSMYKDKITLRLNAKDNYALGKAVFSVSTNGASFTKLAEVSAPSGNKNYAYEYSYDISKVAEGNIYVRFEVYDAAGNKNAPLSSGNEVEVKYVIDHTAPSKVQNIRVTSKMGYIGLQWDESGESDLKAYRIYRADVATGIYAVIENACTTKNYYDSNVSLNGSYVYKIAAVDLAGNEGECSDEIFATVAKDEEKPEITGMSPESGGILGNKGTLKTLAVDNAKLGSVTFEYRKAGEAEEHWQLIRELSTTESAYLATYVWDTSALEEGSYLVRAWARDAAGNVSDAKVSTYQLDHTAPDAPVISTETGNYKITVHIDAQQTDDLYYFDVQRREVGNRNFTSLDKGIDSKFVDWTADPSKVYFYRVGAYDRYGNVNWSEEAEGYALAEDDIPPVAALPENLVGLVGMEMAFDGIGSTDNIRIAEYVWDMGDGHTRNGAQPVYTYQTAGTYTVTLQVKDTSGNIGTASTQVQVYDRVGRGMTKVQVVNEDGHPIPYALVYANLGNGEILSLQSDSNGMATIAASVGAYSVAAYANNYLPNDIDIIVSEYEIREYTLTLVEDELIVGDLTVRRMTMEEMIDAGVDFSDPENYNTYIFSATFTFREEPIPIHTRYKFDQRSGPIFTGFAKSEGTQGHQNNPGTGDGSNNPSPDQANGTGGETPEPILVYVNTVQSISWMKEMYMVELGILNNANSNYTIENGRATLHLPNGLSLAKTTQAQSLTQSMGTVRGQERKVVSWVVRGDASGKYKMTADFEGILMPFETRVSATFETEEEFVVQTGEGITITIMPESSAYDGELYYVQFRVSNGSGRPLYNFKTSIPGYQNPGRKHIVKNVDTGEMQIFEQPSITLDNPSQLYQSVIFREDTAITFSVLMPGASFYGTWAIPFKGATHTDENGEEVANEDVYYQLLETCVETLYANNTGVKVEVEPIDSHITTDYYRTETISCSVDYFDPVDIASGFFKETVKALSLQGASALELNMYYNSGATETKGELGYGWYHDFETYLELKNGVVYYHMNPYMQASFIHDDMNNDIMYGRMQNGSVQLDEGEVYSYGKYVPLSNYLQDVRLERNTDGTYTMVKYNGAILTFDKDGRLSRYGNEDGLYVTVDHEPDRIVLTEEATGKKLYLNYDGSHKLISVSDDYGRETSFGFDGDLLVSYTNPVGDVIRYTYDDEKRILTEENANGVYVTNEYDEQGRVIKQTDGLGAVSTISYEDLKNGGKIVRPVNAAGDGQVLEVNSQGMITKVTDEKGGTIEYTYNARSLETSQKDSYGNCKFKRYDAKGNLVETIDELNHKTFMTYDDEGRLLKVVDNEGNESIYQYDNQGHLKYSKDFEGKEKTFEYNQYGQVTKEYTKGFGTILYGYTNGMLTSVTDNLGGASILEYDVYGNVVKTTDALGNVTTYAYDAVGRNLATTNALGQTTRYTYDCNGNPVAVTDAMGHVTNYTYDVSGRQTKVTYADGSQMSLVLDEVGRVIASKKQDGTQMTFAYDKAGNMIYETLGNGERYSYEYDLKRRRISKTDTTGRVIRYEYYPNDKPYKTIYPDGTYELYTYDNLWNLVEYTSITGITTSYAYDAMGRKTLERDALGNAWHYKYNQVGNLIQTTDPNGNITKYKYDINGQCIEMIDALGYSTYMDYDALGRMTSLYKKTSDGLEQRMSFAYDALGRVVSITDEMGNVTTTEYDICGNITSTTNAQGVKTLASEHDVMGRVTQSVDANGLVTKYDYDVAGKLIKIVQCLNEQEERVTTYEYDNMARLVQVTDPLQGTTKRTFDSRNFVTDITDANGGVTRYEYDSLGRVLSEINAIGAKYDYTYSADGLLKELVNPNGQKTTYEYDVVGRVTEITDETGTVHYTYDKNGNVLTVSDANGSIQRTYDALNRVTSYTDYKGNTVKYSYDELGNLISLTYPGGEIVRYTYYLNSLMHTVTDPNGNVTMYEYDVNGKPTRTIRSNGTVELCTYDAGGRLVGQREIKVAADGSEQEELSNLVYSYDLNGNITSVEGTNTLQTAEGLNRLCSVSMTYDEANRLLTYNGEEIVYDANGNMTYGPVNGVMGNLTYDSRNRLVSAGGVTYAYDPENIRISAETDEYYEEYVSDLVSSALSRVLTTTRHAKEIGTVKDEGSTTIYVYGRGLLSEIHADENKLYYHHYNQVGSTIFLTDADGSKISEYAYGSYGELLSGDAGLTSFLYNGWYGVSTDANGLYYMRQRYYNADIKRFVNQDVLSGDFATSQSLNRYSYVQGNPISYTDPFGLTPFISEGEVYHILLDAFGHIPGVVGAVANTVNAYLYAKEGDTAKALSYAFDAAVGYLGVVGNLLTCSSASKGVGEVIKSFASLADNCKNFYDGASDVGYAVADYVLEHDGTFFTSDYQRSENDNSYASRAMAGLLKMGYHGYQMKNDVDDLGDALGELTPTTYNPKNGRTNYREDPTKFSDGSDMPIENENPRTTIIKRSYYQVDSEMIRSVDAGDDWDKFVGSSDTLNYNPYTKELTPDRVWSADGTKSIYQPAGMPSNQYIRERWFNNGDGVYQTIVTMH